MIALFSGGFMTWTMEGYQREYMSEWINQDSPGNMGVFYAGLGFALFGASSWLVSRQPKPIIHGSLEVDPEKAISSKPGQSTHSAQTTLIKSYVSILMVIIMSFAFIFIVSFVMCVYGIKLPELVHQVPPLPDPLNLTVYNTLSRHRAGPQLRKLYIEDLFTFQRNHYCCGLYSYKDWASMGMNIPDSCCKSYSAGCAEHASSNLNTLFTQGCYDAIVWHYRDLKESYRYIQLFATLCNSGSYFLLLDGLYSLYLIIKCLQILAFCEGRSGVCDKICHCLREQNRCCLCVCVTVIIYLLVCSLIAALLQLGLIS